MEQFNAGESNAASLFKAQMEDQREQFNAQNRLVIDQSNATWRRQVTTTNNAEQNEANRLAAQLTSPPHWLITTTRPRLAGTPSTIITASENAQTRAVELILATMNRDEARAALSSNERMSKESSSLNIANRNQVSNKFIYLDIITPIIFVEILFAKEQQRLAPFEKSTFFL